METHFEKGDWVSIKLASSDKTVVGTVAYVGETEFAPGMWLGLILVPECRKFAKNNGSVQGKVYFSLLNGDFDDDAGFGIFVRPEKVQLLGIDSLLKIPDISSNTKLQLLAENLQTLQLQYANLFSKLEILQVEYDSAVFDRSEMLERYNKLNINFKALESVQNNAGLTSIEDEKLKITIKQLHEEYDIKEEKYIETITLLRNEISMLQSKLQMQSKDLDQDILSELRNSEEIVEKLTFENSDLVAKIEEAQMLVQDLQSQLERRKSTITNLEEVNSDLKSKINKLDVELNDRNDELEYEKKRYQTTNEELKRLEQKQNYMSTGLYSKLIASLQISLDRFTNIINHVAAEQMDLLKFYRSSLQLLEFSSVIKDINHSEDWILLHKQLSFIVNLISYDSSNYLLKFSQPIESINSLILHYLEINDEMNDTDLLLSISLGIPLDVNSIDLQKVFESVLLNREIAIYLIDQTQASLKEELILLRNEEYGINIESFNHFLETGNYEKVMLAHKSIWKRKDKSDVIFDTSEVENLKIQVKLLQSKLLDEKKFQNVLIDLHKKIRSSESEKQQLEFQLKQAIDKGNNLEGEIVNITKKLKKYGIDDTSSTVDEYALLEKKKLLNSIDFQRLLIKKLTTGAVSKYPFLYKVERQKQYSPPIQNSVFKRIDTLFEINATPLTTSQHNHSYKEQQLLQYLNLY